MNIIYGFFNSHQEFGDSVGIAIAEDGEVLATHVSSSESFSAHDLGMNASCTWRHESYTKKYPKGWHCEFVRIRDGRDDHAGLQEALKAHDQHANSCSN